MSKTSGILTDTSARLPDVSRAGAGHARLPGLDGLRGIAILIVLVAHSLWMYRARGGAMRWYLDGSAGVKIFFVLSGFLIAKLLLDERERTGGIDLPRFYARRALRILPPLALFLAVMALFQAAGRIEISPKRWIAIATFTANFVASLPQLAHLWSLAVEEQFYLFFPLLLLLLGARRTAALGFVGVVLLPVLRSWRGIPLPGTHYELDMIAVDWPADFIAWGCLLAIVSRDQRARPFFEALGRPWFAAIALLTIVACEFRPRPALLDLAVGPAIAVIVWWSTRSANSFGGRVLNARPLVALGGISYSLYLWQQVFLLNPHASLLTTFPYSLGFALVAGALSHRLTERPFNRVRRRLTA